jgi:hypothetical protein
VVAASTQGTLTPAEQAWLQKLQQDLGKVPTVVKVRDLGHSPDGQAAQLQVLSNVSQGGAGNGLTTLVKDLRSAIARWSAIRPGRAPGRRGRDPSGPAGQVG